MILFASIAIFLGDKGPILYSQTRTGYKGKEFKIYKLRTMKVNAEVNGVCSLGLCITWFPAANIETKGTKAKFTGKFHGEIIPTVPKGSYLI